MIDEALEELIALYALGGLTAEEQAQVEAIVAQNVMAAARLEEAQMVVSALPLAAEPLAPSATVDTDLLRRVEGDARARFGYEADPPQSVRLSWWQQLQGWLSTPAFGISAVAIAALVLVWGLALLGQVQQLRLDNEQLSVENEQLQVQTADLAAQVTAQDGRIQTLQTTLADTQAEVERLRIANDELQTASQRLAETNESLQTEIASLQSELAVAQGGFSLESADLFTVAVTGTAAQPGAAGQFLIDPQAQEAVLVVNSLPPLPEDQAYQVWLIHGDKRDPAETFQVDPGGQGVTLVRSAVPIASFDAVGVSIEPQGGSEHVTGDVVLLGLIQN